MKTSITIRFEAELGQDEYRELARIAEYDGISLDAAFRNAVSFLLSEGGPHLSGEKKDISEKAS